MAIADPGTWVYVVIISLMLLFAVLSNTLVVYCVATFKKLRTITNLLICNLAVSDILLAGFVIPQRIHDISHEENFYEGDLLCKVVNFFPVLVITSSIYTLVCVSYERHRTIVHNNRSQLTFRKLGRIIPLIWLFSIIISIPTLIQYSVNPFRTTIEGANGTQYKHVLSCDSRNMPMSYKITNAVFVVAISYVVPVVIIFRNYTQVALFVWKRGRAVRNGTLATRTHANTVQLLKVQRNLIKLLVLVAAIFAISWLPYFVLLLYAQTTNTDGSIAASGFVNMLLLALATFSTSYNVILYVVFNPAYRKAIQVVNTDGSTTNDIDTVLNRWKTDFCGLFQTEAIDDDFILSNSVTVGSTCKCTHERTRQVGTNLSCSFVCALTRSPHCTDTEQSNSLFHENMSILEVVAAVNGANRGRACGIDDIPCEI